MTSRIRYNNPDDRGRLGKTYHYEMVSDGSRVSPFRMAIEHVCAERIVLESGTGTGLMALLAARAGARYVYAIEVDSRIAAHARRNFADAGFTNIKLIEKDSLEVTLDDLDGRRAEAVIAENLSTWQVTEPQIQIMNHINARLAKPDALRLPAMACNCFELVRARFRFEDLVELRTHFFQFSGIRAPEVLSEPAEFQAMDFSHLNPTEFNSRVIVPVTMTGRINALRLTSPLRIHQHITFDSSDSLMPPVVVPLEGELEVRRGDQVAVTIAYTTNTDWEQFACWAEVVT